MNKLHFLLAGALAVSTLAFGTSAARADEMPQTDAQRNARTPAEIAQNPELAISYGNITDPEVLARLQQLENQINSGYNGYSGYGYPANEGGYYGGNYNYPNYPYYPPGYGYPQGYGNPYGYYNYGYNYPPPVYSGPIAPSPARGVMPPWMTIIPLGNTYGYPTPPRPPHYGNGGSRGGYHRQNNRGYRGSYRRGGVNFSVNGSQSSSSYGTSTTIQ